MVVFASPLFQFRIMNQAAKIVSDALLGLDFKNVEIGGVVYTIKPPTIKVICSAIHHFSNIGMTGDNIMEAIKKLPEDMRTIFEMNRFKNLKYREIAEELNVSVRTVESKISKSLEFLRKHLSGFYDLILLFIINLMR